MKMLTKSRLHLTLSDCCFIVEAYDNSHGMSNWIGNTNQSNVFKFVYIFGMMNRNLDSANIIYQWIESIFFHVKKTRSWCWMNFELIARDFNRMLPSIMLDLSREADIRWSTAHYLLSVEWNEPLCKILSSCFSVSLAISRPSPVSNMKEINEETKLHILCELGLL